MSIFNIFKRVASAMSATPVLKTLWSVEGVRVEFSSPLPELTQDALLDALSTASAEESESPRVF
jgi:hypothetical protein